MLFSCCNIIVSFQVLDVAVVDVVVERNGIDGGGGAGVLVLCGRLAERLKGWHNSFAQGITPVIKKGEYNLISFRDGCKNLTSVERLNLTS